MCHTLRLSAWQSVANVIRVPAATLAAFEDIRLRPNSMTLSAFPESDHVLAPYAQPSPKSVQLEMTTFLPVTLPACQQITSRGASAGMVQACTL